jgi:hypothetical protein
MGGDAEGARVQTEKQEELAQNVATVSAAEGGRGADEQPQDDEGDYEYEDDFEVSQ